MDRVVGLEGIRAEIPMVETSDGHRRLELTKLHRSGRGGDRHAPANTLGIGHVALAVDDIDAVARLGARGAELVGEVEGYDDSHRLWYVRGPEGIIVELAEHIPGEARSGERGHRRVCLASGADRQERLFAQPLPDELDGQEAADATNVPDGTMLLSKLRDARLKDVRPEAGGRHDGASSCMARMAPAAAQGTGCRCRSCPPGTGVS